MTSLNFPDLNVWLALTVPENVHSTIAKAWWLRATGTIAFSRHSQLGFLRLLTTSAAMGGKPLSLDDAWRVYDGFFEDSRVTFLQEPTEVERFLRQKASGAFAAPKLLGDLWLLAFAKASGGTLVTFDRALSQRGAHCLL